MSRRGWCSRAPHPYFASSAVAVIAVKPVEAGKSRLALPSGLSKRDLILAMLADEVESLNASRLVRSVVVVTSDPCASAVAGRFGAQVVADEGHGLNAAFACGRAVATMADSALLLPGDLPCISAGDVDQVLALADGLPAGAVPDLTGRGTAMLVLRADSLVRPAFGSDSFLRHIKQGAAALQTAPTAARQDVDTLGELLQAQRLGVGPHSQALLDAWGCTGLLEQAASRVPANH